MNYQECLRYLKSLGDEVHGMHFGLERITALLETLGQPHLRYPSVLIAGTNGKGSTARFLTAITSRWGLRTGLFTSPHLIRVEERIAVNGQTIPAEEFAGAFTRVVETVEKTRLDHPATFFELLTAAAFVVFEKRRVELAILEIGMGGRLDSTNVVEPILSIVTPIGLDHQQFLGNSLETITREKLGIARPGRPLLVSPQKEAVRTVIRSFCEARGVPLTEPDFSDLQARANSLGQYSFEFEGEAYQLTACGSFQVNNACLALQAAPILARHFSISRDRSKGLPEALQRVASTGVLQQIRKQPAVFIDGGHNRDAAESLASFVRAHIKAPRTLVFGMMRDKDIRSALGILAPYFQQIFLTVVDSSRAARVDELARYCPEGVPVASPVQAYEKALAEEGTLFVAGSFYLAGLIAEIEEQKEQAGPAAETL